MHRGISIVFALCLAAGVLLAWAVAPPSELSHARQHAGIVAPRLWPRVEWDERAASLSVHSTPPGNFPFQTAQSSDGLVIVHYYNRPVNFGTAAVSTVEGYLRSTIMNTLGFGLIKPVNIYIYSNRADFLAGAQPTDKAETAAFAVPSQSTIYIPLSAIPSDDADSVLPHELTHIVFHQHEDVGHIESKYFRFFPLWLDEGLAEHDVLPGTSYDQFDTENLRAAIAAGQVVNLFQQFDFNYPSDPNTNALCYAEARSFIGYLINVYGQAKFHQFLLDIKDGELLIAAEKDFGPDLQTLQDQWRVTIGTFPLGHDAGNPVTVPSPIAYQPGQIDPIASRTQPFNLEGQDQFSSDAIRIAFLLMVLALASVAATWFQVLQRRQRAAAVQAAEALLTFSRPATDYPLLPGYGSNMPSSPAGAPAGSVFPGSAEQEGQTRVTAPARKTELPRVRWAEMAAVALVPLVVLMSELVIKPSFEWSQSFRTAEVVAAVGVAALLALAVFASVQHRLTIAHVAGVLVAVATLVAAQIQMGAAGKAQGDAYEAQGAYALAIRVFQDAGVGGADLARVQSEWGALAMQAQDYATAVTHLRAAVTADPAAQSYRTALLQAVNAWGQALIAAQQFNQAAQIYQGQLHSPTCDSTCSAAMQNNVGELHLDQADLLLLENNPTGAMAQINLAATQYPATQAAASAKFILSSKGDLLSAGITAGEKGDNAAMNVLLLLAMAQHPGSASAAEATEVPELVTGTVTDAHGSAAGDRLFFAGFPDRADALKFLTTNSPIDASVVKVATTIAPDGSFAARLQPGYWYLPFWDDPTQANNDYFNSSSAPSQSVFMVQPFVPLNLAPITGT